MDLEGLVHLVNNLLVSAGEFGILGGWPHGPLALYSVCVVCPLSNS